jgi:hypothetical protein
MEKALLDPASLRASKHLGRSNLSRIAASLSLLAMTFPIIQTAEAKDFVYSPEGCQFSITFPEEPVISKRCDQGDTGKCYDLVSFSQVYDLEASVNFRVICNPVADSVYDQYSKEIMTGVLQSMSKGTMVESANSSFREEPQYKQAGLAGEGKIGKASMIYIAQLWIAENSAFSLEGELVGEQDDRADQLFANILRTVSYKDPNAPEVEEQTPQEEAEAPAPAPEAEAPAESE